jgi:hypothetical protein
MKRYAQSLSLAAWLLLGSGTGCFVPSSSTSTVTTTDTSASSNEVSFAGAASATNLDGTRIRITWTAASGVFQYYRIYELQADGSYSAVMTVPKGVLAFTLNSLVPGSLHSYIVRAVTSTGETDGNEVLVSAITYAGMTSVSGVGNTTATLNFPAGNQASGMSIYCSLRGADYELMASVLPSQTSETLTGLRSGSTYQCKVIAMSPLGTEDSNPITKTFQTVPASYTGYQGPLLVSAYGAAPGAPSGTPTARQVRLTWLAYSNATVSTSYRLLRVEKGGTIDPLETTACMSAMTSTCVVTCPSPTTTGVITTYDSSSLTGIGVKTCTDGKVAAAPAKYDYYVILTDSTGYAEELPWTSATSGTTASTEAYRITVHIPSDNMVLVHRDSANYEMCQLMSKPSDPLNHQRCAYTGQGAVPYNANPGGSTLSLDAGYYDLGYNMLVNRWPLGCNWTPSTNGGKCGASATNGDCYGTPTPVAGIGVDGNVYWDMDGGLCYVKVGASWVQYANYLSSVTAVTDPYKNLLITNAPDQTYRKPPLGNSSQPLAALTCNAIIDPNYGMMRLLRRREQVVASAWPSLTGEPGALSDSQIATLEAGGAGNCNGDNAHGMTIAAFNTSDETAISSSAVGKYFVLGSSKTVNCVSRFGLQDMVGNQSQWLSDELGTCSAATHSCAAAAVSSVDSGNRDMANIPFNGTGAGGSGSSGPGGGAVNVTEWRFSAASFSAAYFSPALGLPMVGTDGGDAIAVANLGTKLHDDLFQLYTDSVGTLRTSAFGGVYSQGISIGRFYLNMSNITGGSAMLPYTGAYRCAVGIEE